jgi:hypothetical protein
VVQTRVIQYLQHRMDGACLRVIGAVNQAFEPGVYERAGAHSARFNCNKQCAIFQAMIADCDTGFTQGHDLGVRSGIAIGKVPVAATADDLAATHDDCAYRHFSCFKRALRSPERFFHEKFVGACFGVGINS